MATVEHIIEALGIHEDPSSINVLEELGTNCADEDIREQTAQALIQKNTHDSLKTMIIHRGKGINDLSPKVAMATVNEILNLEDKNEVMQILTDTVNMHTDEEVVETARSVKALISLSN